MTINDNFQITVNANVQFVFSVELSSAFNSGSHGFVWQSVRRYSMLLSVGNKALNRSNVNAKQKALFCLVSIATLMEIEQISDS